MEAVQSGDDLMLITAQGMIIRTGLDQIRSIGRNTQGVRLIKLKTDDKLVAAEKIVSEDADNSKAESDKKNKSQSNTNAEVNSDSNTKSKPETKTKGSKKRPKS